MQVADFEKSDPGIAGLMFRCGRSTIETIVVLLEPVSPHTQATVTLDSLNIALPASVIPSGAGLLVPFDPEGRDGFSLKNRRELGLQVAIAGRIMKAVVTLAGLDMALPILSNSCPVQLP